MTDSLLERIFAFERERERRTSTHTEPFAYGTVYLNRDVPHRFDSNFLWAEPPLPDVSAEELVDLAERILGGEGLEHRELVVEDDATGERLAPTLRELGWTPDRRVLMVHRRPADRPAVATVREVGFEEARPLIAWVVSRAPWSSTPEVNAELVGFGRRLEETVNAAFFVAEADGRLASMCELYRIGDVAQVENVDTLEEFRGRGLARAVVLAAVDAASRRGCDLVLIGADVDDWPQQLYAKLGFDPVTRDWTFRRPPPGVVRREA